MVGAVAPCRRAVGAEPLRAAATVGAADRRYPDRVTEPWSEEWIRALDRAARGDEGLRAASIGRRLVIGQQVLDGDRRSEWHLVLDDGDVSVRPGAARSPDVTFSQDADVARAVAHGEMAARTAFVLGHIRVGGDVAALRDLAPALSGLGDLFAPVRASTEGPSREAPPRMPRGS